MKIFKKMRIAKTIVLISLISLSGCKKEWLNEQPLDQLSAGSFWSSESDAMLALTGIYNGSTVGLNNYNNELLILSSHTDDSGYKGGAVGVIYSGYLVPADGQVVGSIWLRGYRTIFKANYFLENIGKVTMDAKRKAEIIAEAKFLRAYEYSLLSMYYGGVPLIDKVLSIDEANNQTRATLIQVVDFAKAELTAAAKDLPAVRPDGQKGRILKAAALAIRGRLLMSEKKWAEAATTYKEVIDLNAHIIDPRYKEIFEETGENSKEIILATNCIAGIFGNAQNQLGYHPDFYGGYQEENIFQELIDQYLMKDGLPIEESALYNPAKPFENRDPRIYATVFLPNYTVFNGRLFETNKTQIGVELGATGYGWKKYVREGYAGDQGSSGDDIVLLRYAEVLLSYLESKLESGEPITQALLNETINKVRGRQAVNLPAVTETNPVKLREILRRERRIEFATERIIRYMDIRRWGIFVNVMNQQFHGMKLTDNPDTYTGVGTVAKTGKYRGHLLTINKTGTVKAENALLPIPLPQIDINPKLIQNPGY